jgi:sugar O-acyltransferase (sialic acid O-acetyltransferase NeuD family)
MYTDWVIVGSGVQGRQISSALLAASKSDKEHVLGFVDDDPKKHGKYVADLPVLGPLDWLGSRKCPLKVAVSLGRSNIKRSVVCRLRQLNANLLFPPIVHPFSFIGPRVKLSDGVVVQAGTVMICDIAVGEFTIVGAQSSLGHDSKIGAYCFISPGLRLAGYGCIEDDCTTGLNTCLLIVKMGSGSTSGAGAVITRDVLAGDTVVGVPAHSVRKTIPQLG